MTFTAQQVDSITQRVIQQLRSRGVVVGGRGLSANVKTSETSPATTNVVAIHSSIITEDVLSAAGVAGKTIQLPSGAVVTPSGRDYIRQHSVTVSNSKSETAAQFKGVVIVSETSATLESAIKTADWSEVTATCDFAAAARVVQDHNSTMVCSVKQPSVAACLLNRSKTFRAAVVNPGCDVSALQAHMNPNVICLNPSGWSIAGIVSLLKQLSENPQQPSMWKEVIS